MWAVIERNNAANLNTKISKATFIAIFFLFMLHIAMYTGNRCKSTRFDAEIFLFSTGLSVQ